MQVNPITPTLGAEVAGIDLAELTETQLSTIEQLFTEHKVLAFRNQKLDRAAHKRFAEHFGKLHIHPSKKMGFDKNKPTDAHDSSAEFFIIDTKADAKITNGEAWHSDVSCEPIPPLASLLYVTKIPDNGGGDTMFADMYAAYDGLSSSLKQLLNDKTAFHDGEIDLRNYRVKLRPGQSYPTATHPVIPNHPVTGRPYLFVNGSFTSHINGLPIWESNMILQGLHEYVARNLRIQCRISWQANTLMMWDNRCLQHQAIHDYEGYSRYGERVSVLPDTPPTQTKPRTKDLI